jgi:hypothetical protein
MDRGVTTGAPAGTERKVVCMVDLADENPPTGPGDLSVTLEAEIIVRLNQHLCVDGTVRAVTNDAPLAHGFMLKDKRPGLITMTFSTGLVESRQSEATGRFHDVNTMRVMALNTIHLAFNDRVMLRQREFRVRREMTLKTGGRILAGVQDKPAFATTHLHVFAARTVARFASTWSDSCARRELHARVSAGGKDSNIVGVTLKTCLVANVISARNGGAHHDRSGCCGAGVCHAQNQKP